MREKEKAPAVKSKKPTCRVIKKLVLHLGWSINNQIKACNLPFAYVGLCYGSSKGADATWDYIQNNMEHIKKNCHGFLLQAMFGRTLCVYGNQQKYDEIKKFFEEAKLETAGRAINQMLEKIQIRAKMLERDGEAVTAYFS